MAGYKLDNLKVLTENNAVGNVVTAGFWESDAIATLLAVDPQKLIIFEPDSALYAAASALYADNLNLEVRNATLANNTGQTDYFVFKPSRFSSILKPAKLLKVYKKNNNDNVVSINVSTVQHVCEQEKILPCAGNILLLGVNCPSKILSDAAQTGHLSYFDVIVVRQPKEGLYETEQQQVSLNTVLQENQFFCVQEIASDATYTQFVYVRDHQHEKVSALQVKVTEAETRNTEISKKLAESEASASQFESRLVDLTALHSHLDTKLVGIKLQNDKLSAANAQQLTEKEELATQVTALQNKQNELVDAQKDKDIQIAELTAQRDQQAKGHQEIRQQAELLRADIEKLSAETSRQKSKKEQLADQVTVLQAKKNELIEVQKNKDTQIAGLTDDCEQQVKSHQETKQQSELLKANIEKLSTETARQKNEKETLAAQVSVLQTHYTELAEGQKNRDAKITELTQQRDQQGQYHKSHKNRADTLKAENDKLSADKIQKFAESEQLSAQFTAMQNKHTHLVDGQKNKDTEIAELTKQRDEQKKLNQEESQQTESLTAGYEDKIKQLSEAVIGLQSSLLKAQEHINEKLESSNANFLKSTAEHMTEIKKSLNWRMDKGFLNTVKQVESFIGVQSYLETGQLAMEYHGWPISSDVALFLLGKIEKNNYDLIIEFGSGTSTQLFAKAINNQLKVQQSKHIDEDLALIGRNNKGSFSGSTLYRELPNRIVTFEHNKTYHNKTMAELDANNLAHLVDLVHAPLIEMKIENDDYLYYSCEQKLAQLATIYAERTVKILVLIDGPPGATGPLARLPAVPLLLNYLGKHQLDIVLDDYKRQEEIETVDRWRQQFEKRSLTYDEEIVQCEKGVFFCSLNL